MQSVETESFYSLISGPKLCMRTRRTPFNILPETLRVWASSWNICSPSRSVSAVYYSCFAYSTWFYLILCPAMFSQFFFTPLRHVTSFLKDFGAGWCISVWSYKKNEASRVCLSFSRGTISPIPGLLYYEPPFLFLSGSLLILLLGITQKDQQTFPWIVPFKGGCLGGGGEARACIQAAPNTRVSEQTT